MACSRPAIVRTKYHTLKHFSIICNIEFAEFTLIDLHTIYGFTRTFASRIFFAD
jgi:hypothetical protein